MARRRSSRAQAGGAWPLAALAVIIAVVILVRVLESPVTWLVLVPLAGGGLWAWSSRRTRHRAAAAERHRRELHDASFLAAADAMSGTQFEHYLADLLRVDGHQGVQLAGGPGDGGADILPVEASGRAVAVQCKRQMAPVSVGVVRQLNGTLAHEHPGRAGVLVTTALLTRPAADLAMRAGITVIDRNGLAAWMASARHLLEQQSPAPTSARRHAAPPARVP